MIWYRITTYSNDIDKIEVKKETKDFIYTEKTKWKKCCDGIIHFKNIKECIEWKVNDYNEKITNLNHQINYINKQKQEFLDKNNIKDINKL